MAGHTFAEFFAGIGLVRLGLEAAHWRCEFANDHDKGKAIIYSANFGDGDLVVGDIHNIKPGAVPQVDMATASFPCTDLSLAGGRAGIKGNQSGTFFEFHRILKGMGKRRPRLVLLENVPGILTSGGGKDIAAVLEALNSLGYRVDILNIDAAWFIPQSRKRIFIIGRRGVKADKSRSMFDKRDGWLKPESLQKVVNSRRSFKWGFVDVPNPPQKSDISFDEIVASNGGRWKPGSEVEKVLRQMGQKHRAKLDKLIVAPSKSHLTAYRRVRQGEVMVEARFDGLSGCLRPPRGGSSRQLLLEAGGGNLRVRYLSAREYARLQGAPDDFEIPASESAGMFGFGDAVCAPAITWLAENVLNQL